MLPCHSTRHRRRGVSAVEVAIVLPIVLLLILGVFEYCRLLMVLNVVQNATRDGARFATGQKSDPTVDTAAVKAQVLNFLAGLDGQLAGYNCDVFCADDVTLNQNPPVIQNDASTDWTQAGFGRHIVVRITGTYTPVVPLVGMPATIPINLATIINSES